MQHFTAHDELQLLILLVTRSPGFITPTQLLVQAWHDARLPEETLRTYIGKVRTKLHSLGVDAEIINRPRRGYALVFKHGNGLDGVETLSDERLKGKRIGVVAGTPPATGIAVNGLMTNAKSYPLVIDTRVDSSVEAMVKDLAAGDIERSD